MKGVRAVRRWELRPPGCRWYLSLMAPDLVRQLFFPPPIKQQWKAVCRDLDLSRWLRSLRNKMCFLGGSHRLKHAYEIFLQITELWWKQAQVMSHPVCGWLSTCTKSITQGLIRHTWSQLLSISEYFSLPVWSGITREGPRWKCSLRRPDVCRWKQ